LNSKSVGKSSTPIWRHVAAALETNTTYPTGTKGGFAKDGTLPRHFDKHVTAMDFIGSNNWPDG